jgi:hypothetical protein
MKKNTIKRHKDHIKTMVTWKKYILLLITY